MTATTDDGYLPCPGEACSSYGRTHWHMPPLPKVPPPAVAIVDAGGTLLVTVDYHRGDGPQLSLSVPSGRLAGYEEARQRLYAEAVEKVTRYAEDLRARFGYV